MDGVVLVVRAGKTPREALSQSIEALNCQNVLGIIFNRLEDASKGYYSYYDHEYARTHEL